MASGGAEQAAPYRISANRDRKGKGGGELRDAADRAGGLMGVAQNRRRSWRVHRIPDQRQTGNTGNDQQQYYRPYPERRERAPTERQPQRH